MAQCLKTPILRPLAITMPQGHERWTHTHPDWRSLSALLRLCNSSALLQLWPQALPALSNIATSHERDPRIRLELFQLLTALLEDGSKADAWWQAEAGQLMVRHLLMPGLVWRAGRVPAAVRYAALTALAMLLSRQRLPPDQLVEVAGKGGEAAAAPGASGAGPCVPSAAAAREGLLARVAGCLDEDYEPGTRQLACHVVELLLSSGMGQGNNGTPQAWHAWQDAAVLVAAAFNISAL